MKFTIIPFSLIYAIVAVSGSSPSVRHKSLRVDISFVLPTLVIDNSGLVLGVIVQKYGVSLLLIIRIVDDDVA